MTQEQLRLIDYYNRFKDILNNGGTWANQESLRMEFIDVVKHYGADTLRRGALLYKEFMDNGLIKDNFDLDVVNSEKTIETITLNTNGTQGSSKIVSLNPEDLDNKDNLLIAHGYNPKYFELVSAKNTKWNNGKKDNGEYTTLYSSKITVKPKQIPEDKEFFKNILDELSETYENYIGYGDEPVYPNDNKCLVLSFNDLHWGRYPANSYANVDTEYKRIMSVMDKINHNYRNLRDMKFEEVILILGSDFFNSDCYGKTSLHKHPQDNMMNFKDMFSSGLKLAVNLIDIARRLTPTLKVVVVPGNHGNNEDYALGKCLEAWYRDDPITTVYCADLGRIYLSFGKNLFGFTHGDKEKKNLGNLMAEEVPQSWGQSENRVWFTGHLHQVKESITEGNGVTIYSCPSLALDDEYTFTHGYTSKKRVMSFIFDKNNGLVETGYFYSRG